MPPKGGPPKKKRNISGLKNQSTSFEISTSQNVDNQPDNNTDGDGGMISLPKTLRIWLGVNRRMNRILILNLIMNGKA
jgi:hypothetical protein